MDQLRLQFPEFTFIYDGKSVITEFSDSHWTGGEVVPEDYFHAKVLDITPTLHRLQHEYAHHLVGMRYYKLSYSGVLYSAAHPDTIELPKYADEEEWMVTALQYHCLNKTYASPAERKDTYAIQQLRSKANLFELRQQLNSILGVAKFVKHR
jgi:hypothetical protein